jgi:hypothetical protein
MVTPENQGGETPVDSLGSSSRTRGRGGLNIDRAAMSSLIEGVRGLDTALKSAARSARDLVSTMGSIRGPSGAGGAGGAGGSSRINMPMAGSASSPAAGRSSLIAASTGGSTGGTSSLMSAGGGAGGGGGGGPLQSSADFTRALLQPASDLNAYADSRIGQGADYSLQADRMSVQLQQMYGMSNKQVRNDLRMPLTKHYLLGGGDAINQMLKMQANTGLVASNQASSVEAMRAVSGFSLGTADVTNMLTSMASPDTANQMFMMAGTGMYGIGGKQRSGMQVMQDVVKRAGLNNPDMLKGAQQQGSNTRQRLASMGVSSPEMQDMYIQYAMQNSEFQKKTGGSEMYDPSKEEDRKVTGIEDNYATQHEKTTGERIKREERFYGRQGDNFARFEKNLRLSTQMLAAFEDKLSTIIGMKISTKGHPLTNAVSYLGNYASNVTNSAISLGDDVLGLIGPDGGDPIDSRLSGDGFASVKSSAPTPTKTDDESPSAPKKKLKASDEKHLASLDPRLASLLRPMLEENPNISINNGRRTNAQQEASFRERYQPTDKTEKGDETDRIWNDVVWELKPEARKRGAYALAAPGESEHEVGLAADLEGDKTWIKDNAARFGLVTGYTGRGGPGDEAHHVEPQSTSRMTGGALNTKGKGKGGAGSTPKTPSGRVSGKVTGSSVGRSYKTVSSTSLRSRRSLNAPTGGTGGPPSTNAGAIASQLVAQSNAKYQSLSRGAALPGNAGDPIDSDYSIGGGGGVSGGGQGMSITVSPNIYLNGSADMSSDIRRIAKEVGDILENEVRLRMMRRS